MCNTKQQESAPGFNMTYFAAQCHILLKDRCLSSKFQNSALG